MKSFPTVSWTRGMKKTNDSFLSLEDKRRKYDQLGRAGLSNHHSNTSHSSNGGYSRFSEDFLNRTFHFHNPFDIFEQFMSHFGMDDDFGKSNRQREREKERRSPLQTNGQDKFFIPVRSRDPFP